MIGKHERNVIAAQRIYAAVLLLVGFAGVGIAVAHATPTTVYAVQGTALSTTRDIAGQPSTPVRYTFNQQDRVEFLTETRAVAGDTVEFSVSDTGQPTSGGSWFEAALLGLLMAIAVSSTVAILVYIASDRFAHARITARMRDTQNYYAHKPARAPLKS